MTPNDSSAGTAPETPELSLIPGFDDPAASGVVDGILSELEKHRDRIGALEAGKPAPTAADRERALLDENAGLKRKLVLKELYIALQKIEIAGLKRNAAAAPPKRAATPGLLSGLLGFAPAKPSLLASLVGTVNAKRIEAAIAAPVAAPTRAGTTIVRNPYVK